MKEWIRKIREHASENYEADGWSYVVEAFSDEDALKAIHEWCKLLDERDKGF